MERNNQQSELNIQRQAIIDLQNTKNIRCTSCDELIQYGADLTILEDKGFKTISDGMTFLCYRCDFEGDIQANYAIMKDGSTINMEDFFAKYVFPNNDNFEAVIEAINLIENRTALEPTEPTDLFEKNSTVYLGEITVDSGQILIVDPCYLERWKSGDVNLDKFEEDYDGSFDNNYDEVCRANTKQGFAEVFNGSAVMAITTNGDGIFPVFGLTNAKGKIAQIIIDFEFDEDDED